MSIGLKYLLLEGLTEKLAVEFIGKEIKGSSFEGKAYLAGGYVRDEILGLDPKDIDIVVEMEDGGIEFATWLTKKLGIYREGANPVIYPRFGTAKFNLRGVEYMGHDLSQIDVECVMTRTEKYEYGSRKPDVSYGTLKQDAERRDFTVNSLMKDLSTGEIKDLTGMGKDDIKKGVVRSAIDPNIIFKEDPLRMLRAVRFAIKYSWTLPLFMIKAIRDNAHMLKTISSERIQDELNKMLVTTSPDKAIRILQMTGANKYVMPELDLLIGLKQNKYHRWDANKHTLEVLKGTPADLKTRLAAVFHDIGKAATKSVIDDSVHFYEHEEVGAEIAKDIMTRLKYPNDIIDAVYLAIKNHMRLKGAGFEGEIISDKALRKLQTDLGDHIEWILDLIHADNVSHAEGHSMPNQIPSIRNRMKNLKMPASKKIELPIDGNDIIKKYKVKPGPIIGKLLKVVEDAWYENPDLSKEEAFKLTDVAIKSFS